MAQPDDFFESSEYLRERAEQARTLAETFRDEATRSKMFKLAAEYERPAEHADRHEGTGA